MASFLDLPGEIRNMIYQQLLILEDPINPWHLSAKSSIPRPETAILYTNRTIHRESISLLYSQNSFDFFLSIYSPFSQFLDQIGPGNAAYIRHIRIDGPPDTCIGGNTTLGNESARMLAKLQSDCINLRTITMGPADMNHFMLKPLPIRSPENVTRTLSATTTRLREFPNIERIIGEVYNHSSNFFIRDEMLSLGWVVRTVEPPEDWDPAINFGDFAEDDYR